MIFELWAELSEGVGLACVYPGNNVISRAVFHETMHYALIANRRRWHLLAKIVKNISLIFMFTHPNRVSRTVCAYEGAGFSAVSQSLIKSYKKIVQFLNLHVCEFL